MKVFISRTLAVDSVFRQQALKVGARLTDQSLIKLTAVPFSFNPQNGWLFFSSRNAVRFFFERGGEIGSLKIGVVGKATAKEVESTGHLPHFVGLGNSTEQIALDFAKEVQHELVTFPISAQSLRTVQKAFPADQITDLIVYQTELNPPATLENDFDVLVFTSPSNVRSFCASHQFVNEQRVVAIGGATAHELTQQGRDRIELPNEPSEQDLARVVFS